MSDMACSTCGKSMAGLGNGLFHCGTCGTVVGCYADGSAAVPKLVERARKFEDTLGPHWSALWHRLGMEESINLPEARGLRTCGACGKRCRVEPGATIACECGGTGTVEARGQ